LVHYFSNAQEEMLTIFYFDEIDKTIDLHLNDSVVEILLVSPKSSSSDSLWETNRIFIPNAKLECTVKLLSYVARKMHRGSFMHKKVNRTSQLGNLNTNDVKTCSYFKFSQVIKTPQYYYVTNENQSPSRFVLSGFPWSWYSYWKIIKLYKKSQIEIVSALKEKSLYY
jgi:hypothetical protein